MDGEEMAINRCHEQRIARNREPTIYTTAAWTSRRRWRIRVNPKLPSSGCVKGNDIIGRLNRVKNSVHNERRCLEFRIRCFSRARLENPLRFEILHVFRCNLRELAVSLAHEDRKSTRL